MGNVPRNFPLARLVEKQTQAMGSAGGYEVIGGMKEGSAASAYFPDLAGKREEFAPRPSEWWR